MDESKATAFSRFGSYSAASALVVGAAAGIPWAWALFGLLPSAAFALIAAFYALIQWRVARASVRATWVNVAISAAVGSATGILVSLTLGRVGSYTWFDADATKCFQLKGQPVPWFGRDIADEWNTVFATAGFLTFGTVGAWLPLRAFGWARARGSVVGAWSREAAACLVASLGWSLANDTMDADFFPKRRDLCFPDIGGIAIVGYGLAALGFGWALVQARGVKAEGAVARFRELLVTGGLAASALLFAAQTVRTMSIMAQPTPSTCGCYKTEGGGTSWP